jgi:hypothetical protein
VTVAQLKIIEVMQIPVLIGQNCDHDAHGFASKKVEVGQWNKPQASPALGAILLPHLGLGNWSLSASGCIRALEYSSIMAPIHVHHYLLSNLVRIFAASPTSSKSRHAVVLRPSHGPQILLSPDKCYAMDHHEDF